MSLGAALGTGNSRGFVSGSGAAGNSVGTGDGSTIRAP